MLIISRNATPLVGLHNCLERVRLKGKGVPSLRNKNTRGDHYVTLVVQVPTDLSRDAKEALRAYDDIVNGKNPEKPGKGKKGFFDKMKEALDE